MNSAAFTGSLAHANPFNPNYVTVMAMLAGIGIGGLIVPAAVSVHLHALKAKGLPLT